MSDSCEPRHRFENFLPTPTTGIGRLVGENS